MSVIQVNFDPTLWAADGTDGTSFGDNGYNCFGTWFDQDGTTLWAFEYFGAGFARVNRSNGTIIHQDAMFGTPGSSVFWDTREDGTPVFTQRGTQYYGMVFNPPQDNPHDSANVLFSFHVASGSAGNLLNGYCVVDSFLDLQYGALPIGPGDGSESIVAWTGSDSNNYLAFTDVDNGRFWVLQDTGSAMVFVGLWDIRTPCNQAEAWKLFVDTNNDLWCVMADTIGSLDGGVELIKWHPADGAATPATCTLTSVDAPVQNISLYCNAYTQTFHGTIPGGASNGLVGQEFVTTGFTNVENNSFGYCVASTATTLVLWSLTGPSGSAEVASAIATGVTRLNVTDTNIPVTTFQDLSIFSIVNFAGYCPSNGTVLLGFESGDLVNVSLPPVSVNGSNVGHETLYTNTYDAPESAMDVGEQPDNSFAIPGNPASGTNAIMLIINPTTCAVTTTLNITSLINASSPTTPWPTDGSVPGFANMRYSSAGSVVAATAEFVGSPLYLIYLTPPTPPTIFAQAVPSIVVAGQPSTLSWATTNATSLVSNELGTLPLNGSMVVNPTTTDYYHFTATGTGGTATATVEVEVLSDSARFELQKLILTMKQEPTTPVRGRGGSGGI